MCAAPAGNQFWKLRSKHGREKLFATPDLLLSACQEYFNWIDGHPWFKVEQLKKPYEESYMEGSTPKKRWVTVTKIPTARPYTIQGLCIYLDCNTLWFNHFEKDLKDKFEKGEDQWSPDEWKSIKDFNKILSHVRDIIYQQKFEGAAVGAFNASIIQRDLGLKEKTEISDLDGKPIGPAIIHIQTVASAAPISEQEENLDE